MSDACKQTIEPRSACELLVETSSVLPNWGCCQCSGYNGLQRACCRDCGHERCGEATLIPLQSNDWARLASLLLCVMTRAPTLAVRQRFVQIADLANDEAGEGQLFENPRPLTQAEFMETEVLLQRGCAMRFDSSTPWQRRASSLASALQFISAMARQATALVERQ